MFSFVFVLLFFCFVSFFIYNFYFREHTFTMEAENEQKYKNPIRMATNHYTHSSSSEASVLRNIFFLDCVLISNYKAQYFYFVDFNIIHSVDCPRDLHFKHFKHWVMLLFMLRFTFE